MVDTLPSQSSEISGLITSLGIFAMAVAATVGGIYKGWRTIKKEASEPTLQKIAPAQTVETTSMIALTQSNHALAETLYRLGESVRSLDRHIADLIEVGREDRMALRTATEESYRLRLVLKDLYERLKGGL